jgi:hypothetical protein
MDSSSFVEMREMRSGERNIFFLFNHSAQPAHVNLSLDAVVTAPNPKELLRGETVRRGDKGWGMDLPPESVRILVFQ